MRPELDPNEMTPDERRQEIAAILAMAFAASATGPPSRILCAI